MKIEVDIINVFEARLSPLGSNSGSESLGFFYSEEFAKMLAEYHADYSMTVPSTSKHQALLLPDGQCFLLASPKSITLNKNFEEGRRNFILAKLTPEERQALGV